MPSTKVLVAIDSLEWESAINSSIIANTNISHLFLCYCASCAAFVCILKVLPLLPTLIRNRNVHDVANILRLRFCSRCILFADSHIFILNYFIKNAYSRIIQTAFGSTRRTPAGAVQFLFSILCLLWTVPASDRPRYFQISIFLLFTNADSLQAYCVHTHTRGSNYVFAICSMRIMYVQNFIQFFVFCTFHVWYHANHMYWTTLLHSILIL